MLNKVLVYLVVIIFGFASGFFSAPIYNFIWPDQGKVKLVDIKIDEPDGSVGNLDQGVQYIPANRAIAAVKELPLILKSQDAENMEFTIEQKPGKEYPVWLVEVKATYSDKIPDIMYVQVDAISGKVLDLTKAEMKIAGVNLTMTRGEAEKVLGKKRKTKKVFDQNLGQSVRIDDYDGLEIKYDSKGLVIQINAVKADFLSPKGVKVGDTKEQVLRVLGRGRTGPASLLTYLPLDDVNQQLAIRLENNNVVELSLHQIRA